MGLSRTGSSASNGSGDYVIAFSTAESVRRRMESPAGGNTPPSPERTTTELTNEAASALFQGVVEATEEAIYNSLFMATAVTSRGRRVTALPLDSLKTILAKYNVLRR
jgi:D-aminopeptidase